MPGVQLEGLDVQFPWVDDPLQAELRRLMSTIEPRFKNLENQIVVWQDAVEQITNVGLDRVNEVLGPLLTSLTEAAQLGFLVAQALDFENAMVQDEPFGITINSPGKELFTPTPFLTIQDNDDEANWGEAELGSYDPQTGDLTVTPSFVATGTTGTNWTVSCGSGIIAKAVAASDAAVAAQNAVETLADQFSTDLDTLQTLLTALQSGAVVSVAGKTGVVTLVIADVSGLQDALDLKATISYVNSQLSGKQASSAKLDSIAASSPGAGDVPYWSSTTVYSSFASSSYMRGLLNTADAATLLAAISGLPRTMEVVVDATTARTLSSTDNGKLLVFSNASAIVVTLPNNLGVGFNCMIKQKGAGIITFTAASGATRESRGSKYRSGGQLAVASLIVDANSSGTVANYTMTGDLQV